MSTISEKLRAIGPLRRLVVSTNFFLDRSFERRLNINTMSLPMDPNQASKIHASHADGTRYETLPYWLVKYCLKSLVMTREDVVYDIGCGLGRLTCWFSLQPVKRCVGVELCEAFAEIARRNATAMKGRVAPIEILTQDAATVDYSEGTVFVLFQSLWGKNHDRCAGPD
jgi:SAM-dependent methyltransferase